MTILTSLLGIIIIFLGVIPFKLAKTFGLFKTSFSNSSLVVSILTCNLSRSLPLFEQQQLPLDL